MGVSSSLYSSISGLNTMGNAMSVLGDNVSNVNTIAFKSSRATFQDVLSQSVSTAAGAAQVGRGVTLSTVNGLFAQGSFESTTTPTDLAIGGQGFFMLRASDNAAADMYSRAGEFRFDKEGFLINPVGHFVQGWTIDSASEEVTGTIGDINIGKSTPPVQTEQIDVIVNVDSREDVETSEVRLFDAWNGTNAAAVNPTDPIDSTNYEYTSAIKIYDSQGASHDVTIYFDRTTKDNQWEYLVTCDPAEDQRVLTGDDLTTYAPNTTFNYEEHKGAGALMYGIIDFNTSGDITDMTAWSIPPDGEVDPARTENRMVLGTTDKYYSFNANFTGASTDQEVRLNFGARYGGSPTNMTQVLVTDGGAYSDVASTNFITKETLWSSVYDSAGNQIAQGDSFFFSGYQNDGTYVEGRYTVDETEKVQDLLDVIDNTFGAKSSIDASGRIRIQDNTGGDSGMFVTTFTTTSADGATPFGGSTVAGTNAVASDAAWYVTSDGVTPVSNPNTLLIGLEDATALGLPANIVGAGETFAFDIVDISTGVSTLRTFTEGAAAPNGGTTIQDVLTWIEDWSDNGALDSSTGNKDVTASLGADGRIYVTDNTLGASGFTVGVTMNAASTGPAIFGAFGAAYAGQTVTNSQVDITSSKQENVSPGRAFSTSSGTPPVITANTTWDSVYSDASPGVVASGTWVISGTKAGVGTTATSASFSYDVDAAIAAGDTVQELLNDIETAFDADAYIDGAGRLVLRDRMADTTTNTSNLSVSIAYGGASEIFGPDSQTFTIFPGDLTEDGSRMGDVISSTFSTEALASTQYANSSTTIFQDQDGFSAGFLQSVSVDTDGVITGNYSNGQVLKKAQVALASFNNLAGLNKEGGNIFRETTESGAPVTGAPGTNGLGSIAPNSLEQSNVDLGNEFVKLITTQRGFQANSKIITTTDEMLADLINIKR
ncbi:MAG: flagellar hook-basal body complex protein [Desulfobulbaceae bacterium]|nr:flagellar hook-basal body complex protein [Desulfobulbaceae bacterium]HIJ78247.1 flagellar hook-basal body complex protein [Deltaproteobacteria bacterium]